MTSARPIRPTRRVRIRNFITATVALTMLSGALVWREASAPVLAKSATVPFRLMEASILETQAALEAGTITSEDLVRMYLARIDAYDKQGPKINALTLVNPNALAEARALDLERQTKHKGSRGPLHGIPVLLKDNYDTFDMPTTAASLSLASSIPPDDGYLVRRLREAGAVFIGKTNLHEFAFGITTISSLGGQTLNPYDLTRNPGGSSGGTGAAVAANFAVVGMGSDTCGSIRIPSAHNSLVGLRVTQGLFSRDGIIPLSLTQDVGGPIARNVEDLAVVMDLTAGFDPNDPITEISTFHTPGSYTHFLKEGRLKGSRFGVLTDAMIVNTPGDDEVAGIIRNATVELEQLGATIIDVSIPDYNVLRNVSVITNEFKANLEQYLAATPAAPFKTLQAIVSSGLFHPSLTGVLNASLAAAPLPNAQYLQRLAGRETFKAAILKVMDDNDLDALIYPTIRQKPIPVPSTGQPGTNCHISAHSGLPAISMPGGFTNDGLPVGMEFLGHEFAEGELLQLAYSWEQATHHRRVPASTPAIDPHWTFRVSDGSAAFSLNPDTNQFRFTAPGVDTFDYIDPAMKTTKGVVRGELKDSHWHIRYSVPAGVPGTATIWVDNRWKGGETYTLFGTAVPQ